MRTHQLLAAAGVIVAFLIVLLLGLALFSGSSQAPRGREGGFVSAIEKAQPGVVLISAPGDAGAPEAMPMGSGVVVSPDGLIVTVSHVVGRLPVVGVVFADGTSRRAEVVGIDAAVDVAVLRTPTVKPLPYLALADSGKVKAGQQVVLLGAPFGLTGTATSGIVSSVGRRLEPGTGGVGFIQTDAALTEGGSGGPLVNGSGEVIGLASAQLSRGEPGAGLAFAIPSNLVKAVLDRLAPPAQGRR